MITGRRLDSEIAIKIFGWTRAEQLELGRERYIDENGERQPLPHYSTDIATVWEIVEKMSDLGYTEQFRLSREQDWENGKKTGKLMYSACFLGITSCEAETASYAICLAALAAKEYYDKN